MPTTEIEGPNGWIPEFSANAVHHSSGLRRYRIQNLDDSAPSDAIDCRGFSMAWLVIDTIHTASGALTEIIAEAMTELSGGQANTVETIQGPAPLFFHKRPTLNVNIRTAGWFYNPPSFLRFSHSDAAADFDLILDLIRTPVER